MSIAILAAQTGYGHNSVMNTLKDCFNDNKVVVDCYPSFYEDLLLSNKILSDFYNYLLSNSIELCNKYCEFTSITRYDLSNDFYKGVKEKIVKFLISHNYKTIISVTHTINPVMIRIIKELKINLKYYIVITDPFEPIAVGYSVIGADKYYCATEFVKSILVKSKIEESKIMITGYPINKKFLSKPYENCITANAKLLINCGGQGTYHFYYILKHIMENNNLANKISIRIICGDNTVLFNQCTKYIETNAYQNICVYGFVNNMEELLGDSDMVLTKAGANSFFEALYCNVPVLIDATNGLIYQEKGVKTFLEKYDVGIIVYNYNDIIQFIELALSTQMLNEYRRKIQNYHFQNGTSEIINDVLNEME